MTACANVFVTGATGRVGSSVVPLLQSRGVGITALVKRPMSIAGCRAVACNLEQVEKLATEIGQCDAIVHLASPPGSEPPDIERQDVCGTAGLIGVWRKGPFVYASSAGVYGTSTGAIPEKSPIYPWNSYIRGKLANELQLRLAERRDGRAGAASLRPGFVLTDSGRPDRHILRQVFSHCQLGKRFVFNSEQGLERFGHSFIGINDFGRAIADTLEHDLSGPFNIASGFCTWRDLIQMINRLAGTKGDFVIRPDTGPQAGEYLLAQSRTELDTSAFAKATGFQPRETLEEIVEAFVRMERAQPA